MSKADKPKPIFKGSSRRYCLACSYSLRGLVEPRCPECGREFDPVDPATYSKRPVVDRTNTYRAVGLWIGVVSAACWIGAISLMIHDQRHLQAGTVISRDRVLATQLLIAALVLAIVAGGLRKSTVMSMFVVVVFLTLCLWFLLTLHS